MAEFRRILSALLDRDNASKKKVAEFCNVNPSAVTHWANGSAKPTLNNLMKLSEYFKVSINYLLGMQVNENLSDIQHEMVEGMLYFSDDQMAMFHNFYKFLLTFPKKR
ncbi:MAG: helix-turn-helix transcriptional regulator [Candidatus Poribacteria bacterium]|nr:helix-turn-helix transcriptional regulator [Candidatus Poribacteria bacterium]